MRFVQPIRDSEVIEDIKDYLRGTNERNYILFVLGINIGLRITDILRLRVRDVTGSHISIIERKTKKHKRILIQPDLKKELTAFIEGKPPNEYLFKSREGWNRPITRYQAYKIMRAIGDEFGLSDIGCHSLRKTFGYIFYYETTDKDVAMLMDYFNHSSQRVTLRYIGVEQDTMDAALKRHRA